MRSSSDPTRPRPARVPGPHRRPALATIALTGALLLAPAGRAAAQPAAAAAGQVPAAGVASDPPAASPQPAAEPATSPHAHAQPAAGEHGAAAPAGHAEGEEAHAEGWLSTSFVGRIFNFLVLAGGLWYFLRSPVGKYLSARADQIHEDLALASATRKAAEARLAEIEARVRALPAEIDALKQRGAEEVVAEETRIREAADMERARLIEQTRREIDMQLRAARRDLTQHAADLAVGIAASRLRTEVTTEDQHRLFDRYLSQVRTSNEH